MHNDSFVYKFDMYMCTNNYTLKILTTELMLYILFDIIQYHFICLIKKCKTCMRQL